MDIGQNIKKLRELKNYTQAYMASQLNMSVSGYCKIEKGQTDITLSKINLIADVLETDMATILNFDAKNVINQHNNYNSIITGYLENQNINGKITEAINDIQNDLSIIKNNISKNNNT
jgi:transcriptional regulator with XRE-family HTH domain